MIPTSAGPSPAPAWVFDRGGGFGCVTADRSAVSIRRCERLVTLTAANAPSARRTRIPRTITSSMGGDPTGRCQRVGR